MNTYFTETIPQIVQKMGHCNFSIDSAHLVQITHINNPHSFYVRMSKLRYAVKLLERRGARMTGPELAVGKIVVYKSRTINRCVRGRVHKINTCKKGMGLVCSLLAIDYGWVDTHVLLKHIFFPVESSLICGPLALHCQLTKCEPLGKTFDLEAVHAMKFFVGKYTSKIIIKFKTTNKLKVELRTVECRDDVATMLGLMKFTSFFRMHERPSIPLRALFSYKHRQLKVGEKMRVRVQSGSSIYGFYVAEIEDYKNYDNVIEWYKFTKYCMEQPSLDVIGALMDGRACGVKVLNPVRYERAIVKRITVPNAKALVQLLDWGKQIEANFEDIKPVGLQFIERPAMALFCIAERIQCLNYGFGLRMIYPGLEFMLEVAEPGIRFRIPHKVKLYPIYPMRTRRPFSVNDAE